MVDLLRAQLAGVGITASTAPLAGSGQADDVASRISPMQEGTALLLVAVSDRGVAGEGSSAGCGSWTLFPRASELDEDLAQELERGVGPGAVGEEQLLKDESVERGKD
jgi:hypothetical protein